MSPLPVGKLSGDTLQRLFAKYVRASGPPEAGARVIVGPRVGEDAAVLDMGDRYLVATTDPITFATDAAGWPHPPSKQPFRYSGISANVHTEPPDGTLVPATRRASWPPSPEAMVTYCWPLWV